MKKVVFSSDELPAHLDDRARFKLWNDLYTERYGDAEISCLDSPFSARSKFSYVGDIGLVQSEGTIQRYSRTSRQIATDQREDFLIGLSRCRSRMSVKQRGREAVLAPGGMIIYTNVESSECFAEGANAWSGLSVPRSRLLELVANTDDLIGRPFDAARPAIRHLSRYIDFLLASEEIVEDPQLIDKASAVVLDLAVLALGARGDAAEIARGRGLRAARVQEILSEVGAHFSDLAFSAHTVALKLDLSPRYIQELVQETGWSFTERVLELRLQKARAMLADPCNDQMSIAGIALACGFNEVSYFSRCFRRRFGCSPTQYRGGNGERLYPPLAP
jgi:AraC-like DNA-binding protein